MAGDIVELLWQRPDTIDEHFLHDIGVPSDLLARPDNFVPAATTWTILAANIRLRHDETQSLSENPVKEGFYELVVASMLQSATLGDALRRWEVSSRLVFPDIESQVVRRNSRTTVRLRFQGAQSPARDFYLEASAAVQHMLFCWLTGQALQAVSVRTARHRGDNPVSLLALIGPRRGTIGAGVEWVYSSRETDLAVQPLSLDSWREGIYKALGWLEARLASHASSQGGLGAKILHILAAQRLTQTQIAHELAMSPATLRRRLTEEGESFRSINDRFRKQAAASALLNAPTVEQAAASLGFADARSFRRSFERWYGCNPSDYRKIVSEKVPL